MAKQRMQPIAAFQALRRLIADPEQTHEVFTVIRALSGSALDRGFRRFTNTATGRMILREKRNLLDTLNNREALAELPAQSLARHYLNFVQTENLTADGLVEASEEIDYAENGPSFALFATRQRDMHDLWHTLTRYGRDELGEALLLAFTYAQSRNRGIGIICLAGCLELSKTYGRGVFRAAYQAYRDGKNAAWLPAQDWEYLLTQPIDEVRQALRIPEPVQYSTLRSEAIAAA